MMDIDVNSRGIYNDLVRKFRDEGHNVFIVCPLERRTGKKSYISKDGNVKIMHVRTLNLQKTNVIEKGLGQLSLELIFKHAIKRNLKDIVFDLILYSTPPITFTGVVKDIKKSNPKAVSYLLLKDIFPQNAVDMGMLSTKGIKGILYKFFRKKEKNLYFCSDYIGCMSPANVEYLLRHNPEISPTRVEVAPNSVELIEAGVNIGDNVAILAKYNLPIDRPIFIYGGNLGVPQGIPFLIECLNANSCRNDCHFLVVGSGTYFAELSEWYNTQRPKSVTVLNSLSKKDYDKLVSACHVGLIFLDYRFTIPNFPSRLLSYLECKMPVICATDPNCDMGHIAEENGFGYYVPSNSVEAFTRAVDRMLASNIKVMGECGYSFLKDNYLVDFTYNQVIKHLR